MQLHRADRTKCLYYIDRPAFDEFSFPTHRQAHCCTGAKFQKKVYFIPAPKKKTFFLINDACSIERTVIFVCFTYRFVQ